MQILTYRQACCILRWHCTAVSLPCIFFPSVVSKKKESDLIHIYLFIYLIKSNSGQALQHKTWLCDFVRKHGYLWVIMQQFATVMLHIGEWVTHPFSRHIFTLWITAPAFSWAQWKSDVREEVLCEWSTRFLLHQDTADLKQPGFTAIGQGVSDGISMTQLQHPGS